MSARKTFALIIAAILGTVLAAVIVADEAVASPGATVITGALTPPKGVEGSGWYAVDTTKDTLDLHVTAGKLKKGYCLTVYVDIARKANVPAKSGTHYDARAVRSCQAHGYRGAGVQHEGSTYGIDVTGVQKVAICYGKNNTIGTCHIYKGTEGQIKSIHPQASSKDKCTRFWSRSAAGKNYYFSAGNVFSCQS